MGIIKRLLLLMSSAVFMLLAASCSGGAGATVQIAPDWAVGKWYDSEGRLIAEIKSDRLVKPDDTEIIYGESLQGSTSKNMIVMKTEGEFSIERDNGSTHLIVFYIRKISGTSYKCAMDVKAENVGNIPESELRDAAFAQSDSEPSSDDVRIAPSWADGEWYVSDSNALSGKRRVATIRSSYFMREGDGAEIEYDKIGVNNTVRNSVVRNSETDFSIEQHDEHVNMIVLYIRKKNDGGFEYARTDFSQSAEDVTVISPDSFVSVEKGEGTQSNAQDDTKDGIVQTAPDWAIGKWYYPDDVDNYNNGMDAYNASQNPEDMPDFIYPHIIISKHSYTVFMGEADGFGVEYNRVGESNGDVRNYIKEKDDANHVFKVVQNDYFYDVMSEIVSFKLEKKSNGDGWTIKGGAPEDQINEDNTYDVVKAEVDPDSGKLVIADN